MKVTTTLIVLALLALAATITAYMKSPALAWEGASTAARLFVMVLPNLLVGFLLAGMVQVLLPRDLVVAYAGEDSGWAGLTIATIAGSFTPGGPFVQFPLVASLWKAGTGIGPISAYLTAWALLGFQRILVWEAPLMGWRYAMVRVAVSLPAPFLIGWAASWIFRRFFSV